MTTFYYIIHNISITRNKMLDTYHRTFNQGKTDDNLFLTTRKKDQKRFISRYANLLWHLNQTCCLSHLLSFLIMLRHYIKCTPYDADIDNQELKLSTFSTTEVIRMVIFSRFRCPEDFA